MCLLKREKKKIAILGREKGATVEGKCTKKRGAHVSEEKGTTII